MTTENKKIFKKFTDDKICVCCKTENDLRAFLGLCEASDLKWASGCEALAFIPEEENNVVLYFRDNHLTFGRYNLCGEKDRLVYFTGVTFEPAHEVREMTLEEVREMTLEEVEKALGYKIKLVSAH